MAIDLKPFKTRLAALQQEALTSLGIPNDAVGYHFHQQESMPYWINRLGDTQVEGDGEEIDVYTVTMYGRLYIGHPTDEIARGAVEQLLDTWILQLIQYFNEHELLQSEAYPSAPDSLSYCRVTSARGYTEFMPEQKIGTEFTFSLVFSTEIDQAYL